MEYFIKLWRLFRPLTFATITSNVQRDLARLKDLQDQDNTRISKISEGLEKAAVAHRNDVKLKIEAHEKTIAALRSDFTFLSDGRSAKVKALQTSNKEASNYATNLELLTKGKLVTVAE